MRLLTDEEREDLEAEFRPYEPPDCGGAYCGDPRCPTCNQPDDSDAAAHGRATQ